MSELDNVLFCEKLLTVISMLEKRDQWHDFSEGLIIRTGNPIGEEIFTFLKSNRYIVMHEPGTYTYRNLSGLKALCLSTVDNSNRAERIRKENRTGNIIIIIITIISTVIGLIALINSLSE